jgi:hypothetical protein
VSPSYLFDEFSSDEVRPPGGDGGFLAGVGQVCAVGEHLRGFERFAVGD